MRRAALCIVLCFMALPAFGQFHIPPPRFTGWHVTPAVQISVVAQDVAYTARVAAGITFNETVSVGLAAHALVNDVHPLPSQAPLPLRFVWAGLDFGWVFDADRLVHPDVGVTIGPGIAWYDGSEVVAEVNPNETDWMLVGEGRAGVVLNLTSRFRVGVYYTARLVDEASLKGIDGQALQKQGLLFALKIGSF